MSPRRHAPGRGIPLGLGLLVACGTADKSATTRAGGDSAPATTGGAETGSSTGGDTSGDGGTGHDGGTGDGGGTSDDGDDAGSDTGTVDHCTEVDAFVPVFGAVTDTWAAQDAAAPWPAGGLVVAGSSSVRRWESLAVGHPDHAVIQRGFGGAQLGELALEAEALISVHDPGGVVVFAGTNDLAAGVDAATVSTRLRCLHQRLRARHGPALPVIFVGITPTPARWHLQEANAAVDATARELAAADPAFGFADVPAAFLATGSPPDAALFVDDGLHLSAAGYALWDGVISEVLDRMVAPTAPVPPAAAWSPDPGTRLRVDLGASDTTNGEPSASPDHLGNHWNNWHTLAGGAEVYPGERLADLVTTTGAPTPVSLVVTGGFFNNGRAHGGLLWPDTAALGALAVGTATEDFFYAVAEDQTGGLQLRGLDPTRRYTLRLFATRATAERRVTRATLTGAATATATVQTSGPGTGPDDGNTDQLIVFEDAQPTPSGHLDLDLAPEEGPYAYLGLLELEAR